MARWAELPVLRARFQRSKVIKLKGEEQNRESDGQTAPFWLWTDTNPGEEPGSRHFYFGGRSGTSCLKPGGGTSCLEGTKGRGLVGSGGLTSAESLLPAFQSRGGPPLIQSGTEALGGAREEREGVIGAGGMEGDGPGGGTWRMRDRAGLGRAASELPALRNV